MADTGSPKIQRAFELMKEKNYEEAEKLLQSGLRESEQGEKKSEQALFHSVLGILFKLKEDFQNAWRHYEKAEKLLPDDPALKIITAKCLIDQFAQFDTAIKKLKKVLKLTKGVPSFEHQANALLAIAYLKKGDRKEAIDKMVESMRDDFQSMITADNINLDVVAAFAARNFELDLCRQYLEKGLTLAHQRSEKKSIQLFERLLKSCETPPSPPVGEGG